MQYIARPLERREEESIGRFKAEGSSSRLSRKSAHNRQSTGFKSSSEATYTYSKTAKTQK
jgi:hypothetical protein